MKFYHQSWFWLVFVPAITFTLLYAFIPNQSRADVIRTAGIAFVLAMTVGQILKYMCEN
jgi:uncharacterized BrkB/YihY/UPF0761 family membrane protein